MKNKTPTLLILAAGLGSRYGSLKQIDRIGPSGERIIDYSVYDALRGGFGKIVYVIRKSFELEFQELILDVLPEGIQYDYVCQELDSSRLDYPESQQRVKPWGTGHALLTASDLISEPFAVINADDFYGAESFRLAADFLNHNREKSNPDSAMIGYILKNTLSKFGSVSRAICQVDNKNHLTSLVERTKIKKTDSSIVFEDTNNKMEFLTGNEIVSMNMFALYPGIFHHFRKHFREFVNEHGTSPDTEFYLPAVLNNLVTKKTVRIEILKTTANWFGLTYPEDKQIAIDKISMLVKENKYPENLWKAW